MQQRNKALEQTKRKETRKEKVRRLIRKFEREVREWGQTHTELTCGLTQIRGVVYLTIKKFRGTKKYVFGKGLVTQIPAFNPIQKVEIQGFIAKLRRIFTEFNFKSMTEKVTAVICGFALPAELISA